jgi:hypothetical protein
MAQYDEIASKYEVDVPLERQSHNNSKSVCCGHDPIPTVGKFNVIDASRSNLSVSLDNFTDRALSE